jgi:hypothetical protein
MKFSAVSAILLILSAPSLAAVKPCAELVTEIEARLKEHKVGSYTLVLVDADKAGDGKVIGTCEGGKKKVVYSKK